MPYIAPDERVRLDACLETLGERIATDGQFNYALTFLLRAFVEKQGGSYAAHSAGIAALECAKLEHYRTRVARHEDAARRKHGDVRLEVLQLPNSPDETTAGPENW